MSIHLDLEWSKKLKKEGIEGKHAYCHFEDADEVSFIARSWNALPNMVKCPAYTLEELLDMVKGEFLLRKRNLLYEIRFIYKGRYKIASNADPKIAVAEALLWQSEVF
ncbi:MAG: hypothetical protein U9Q97_08370 [Acidobacteriota bacterium]|nr:hypothetical protein [Acidobacteriota bacterium]